MKPRNKYQKRIIQLSGKIPCINEKQLRWGYQHCLEHIGRRLKSGKVTCMECGHEFTCTEDKCNCPACHQELKIMDTRKRIFDDYQYYCIITKCREFQVLRFFYLSCYARIGKKASYFHSEVFQRWLDPSGKVTTVSKPKSTSFYMFRWQFWGKLEIKKENYQYNVNPVQIYPRQLFIPEIKRTGFTKNYLGLTPYDILRYLLCENKGETLLKENQLQLLKHFAYDKHLDISKYWPSMRICFRNKYQVEDAQLWCDYIKLLDYFNLDLRNAKYVCPADLKAQHDKLMIKRSKILERERQEQQRQWEIENRQRSKEKLRKDKAKMRRNQKTYEKYKAKFFDISFTDGEIQVLVLKSITEFYIEGEELFHCLFTNDYFKKSNSLILSARIGSKRIETIEISLDEMKILQCQGYDNQNSEYHERIIELVNKNMKQIQKRVSA